MPTCAACAGSRVPAPPPPSAAATTRRYSTTTSSPSRRTLQARCLPSPSTGLSPAPTTTKAPPRTRTIGGHRALPRRAIRVGSHVHCRSVSRIGAQLFPCGPCRDGHAAPVTHPRRHEVLAAGGQEPARSTGPRAPHRQPISIGFELRGVLRRFNHWIASATPLCLACQARTLR